MRFFGKFVFIYLSWTNKIKLNLQIVIEYQSFSNLSVRQQMAPQSPNYLLACSSPFVLTQCRGFSSVGGWGTERPPTLHPSRFIQNPPAPAIGSRRWLSVQGQPLGSVPRHLDDLWRRCIQTSGRSMDPQINSAEKCRVGPVELLIGSESRDLAWACQLAEMATGWLTSGSLLASLLIDCRSETCSACVQLSSSVVDVLEHVALDPRPKVGNWRLQIDCPSSANGQQDVIVSWVLFCKWNVVVVECCCCWILQMYWILCKLSNDL